MNVLRMAVLAIVCLGIVGCAPSPVPSPGVTPIRPLAATSFAPDLEALLPTALAGSPMVRFSVAGAHFENGGDVCYYLCPGELTSLARQLGLGIDQVDVALDLTQDSNLAILAIRIRGSDPTRLIPAWLEMKRARYGHAPETLTIAGKSVVGVNTSMSATPQGSDYMYVSGGVLFVLMSRSPVPPAEVPPLVTEALTALP